MPQQRMPGIAHGSSKTKEMENNISLFSYVDEICDCTLNKTQPYDFNKNGGTTNNLKYSLSPVHAIKEQTFPKSKAHKFLYFTE